MVIVRVITILVKYSRKISLQLYVCSEKDDELVFVTALLKSPVCFGGENRRSTITQGWNFRKQL